MEPVIGTVPKPIRLGGERPIEALTFEHHEFIKAALDGTGTHAGRQYQVVRSTERVAAGDIYTFVINFEDDETQQLYKITAWSRPWMPDKADALKLTFERHE